jgi:hypothetical protein
MGDFAAEQVTSSGLAASIRNATVGPGEDTVPPDSIVRANNGSGASVTLTVVTPGTVDGLAITDRQVVIPAGQARYVRLPRAVYRSPADGKVHLQWSAVTSVTFEVIR